MNQSKTIIGIIIIAIGLSIFLSFPIFSFLIAVLLVWIGIRVLTGKENRFNNIGEKGEEYENKINRVLIFSGINKKYKSDKFEGGEVVAIFGGGEIDLSEVTTKEKEIKLSFVAIFGGLKIILPKEWQVESQGVGILGGFNNNSKPLEKTSVKVSVEGVAIFGGVDLVN